MKTALVGVCALVLSGCYFTRLGVGQLALLNDQRALSDALADESDPERRLLLQHVPDLRRYANERLQLRPGNNYTGYVARSPDAIAYVVTACQRTRFESYTWWFPIAGEVPYKSHFDEASAQAEAAELRARGYDVHVGPVTAYSTLGLLRDPITTPMLRGGLVRFVEVLFHEMAHARFYVRGQSDFNEQLASFVGQRGAQEYLRSRYAHDATVLAALDDTFRRRAALDALVFAAIDQLQALYDSGFDEFAILARREPVLHQLAADLAGLYPDQPDADWSMNNARLMQWQRYSRDAGYLQRLFDEARGSWRQFWFLVEGYAESDLRACPDQDATGGCHGRD